MSLCAFLAAEPIPLAWFPKAAATLPGLLAGRVADPVTWQQTLGRAGRSSLVRIDQRGLQLHRLTQAILRAHLTRERADATRACAGAVLAAAYPGSAGTFATWRDWARLVPHLLAVDPASPVHDARVRNLACNAAWYLLRRGDTHTGLGLFRDLHEQWRDRLDEDDPDTLRAANGLAVALRAAGQFRAAKELNEETLTRRRRLYGDDHPATLISAGNLAADLRALGELPAARNLNEDNLTRRRRIHGDDHPDTLVSATCLALDLHASGQIQVARELNQDTLSRRRRVLGYDHPSTLTSASNLADNLRVLGEAAAAAELERDTLTPQQRVHRAVGSDQIREPNPKTLATALRRGALQRACRRINNPGRRYARPTSCLWFVSRRRRTGRPEPDSRRSSRRPSDFL